MPQESTLPGLPRCFPPRKKGFTEIEKVLQKCPDTTRHRPSLRPCLLAWCCHDACTEGGFEAGAVGTHVTASLTAGLVATTISNPFDVIKAYMFM